jgi:hypothetical protein
MMWRRRRARQSAGRKEEEEDSGGGGRRCGRLERKRRVVWTSNLREQGRGLGLGRRLWLRGGRPMRRGGEDLGRRRIREGVRRGGGGSGRRGRLRLVEKWRRRGLGLVELIFINITMNFDLPIARSTAPGDRGVGGLT